ncbi:hypothetical protein THAOC_28464 [Thalassiosira oceanica]|uniref:Uncharacterized protein n=1 Tax=Thalassiosira oceanica TaxID=159749 RepID=K0RF10_THAOC|nr:hypothetical protein THAOC_28464 [Thalassiosira oceanica]|eukprot:EJK52283.1 hypothetical protein THAOC_28464 [Thalassiosira oceanica]
MIQQGHCLLTAAEGGPIDDQADNWELINDQAHDWELIDSSEIPSLPLTAQGRIDFARLTHKQCDRTNPALADVIHAWTDLQQQLGASFLYEEDPLECLLNSAPAAPMKTLPVNSDFSSNRTPTAESIQRVDTKSCTTNIDARAQRWIGQQAPFQVLHYDNSDTTQSSLSSSDIRVHIPSDEMTIPVGTENLT